MTSEQFFSLLSEIFGERPWPRPLHLWPAAKQVSGGGDAAAIARSLKVSQRRLVSTTQATNVLQHLLGRGFGEIEPEHLRRSRLILGQLLLGRCAEIAFEEIYRQEMPTQEFHLRDLRESRTDTDYRVYNGQNRPVYRINIKFHGSRFRRASELVGLDPQDCFALATYKVYRALLKQEEERLPYFFAIVGVPELTGESVGQAFPADLAEAVALIHHAPKAEGKRDFEDTIIDYVVHQRLPIFEGTLSKIVGASWFILSARKADLLLRQLLYDRVYALRVRNFAQQFRGAELDMHFSLSTDLTPMHQFLTTLKNEGATKVATLLERGEF